VTGAPRDAAIKPLPAAEPLGALPYGPAMTRILKPLYNAFLIFNRYYTVPAVKLGLAPLHANPVTGPFMLLRTRGRTSGRIREAPLGYVILDGCVYCCAGFGPRTQWYRNIRADRRVEVVLPAAAFAGVAEEVIDIDELDRAWRALLRAMGLLGRSLVADVNSASAEELRSRTANLPLIRIRPTGIAAGPSDPGGWLWATMTVVGSAWVARRLWRFARRS
jgi:deazaflavin-dependent oxidoreductase (nitroreductase family)